MLRCGHHVTAWEGWTAMQWIAELRDQPQRGALERLPAIGVRLALVPHEYGMLEDACAAATGVP